MKKILAILVVSRLITYALPFLFTQAPDPSFNRWDAPHYLYIAQYWYAKSGDEANFIVFPPLYPILLSLTSRIPLTSPILFSNFLFILGGLLFYKVVALYYKKNIAFWATIFLCIFPTSYFFSAPYTESLFLLLSAGVFYLIYKKMWFTSAILASMAMLTRTIGLLLFIPIVYEVLQLKPKKYLLIFAIGTPFFIATCFYLLINYLVLGDPLAFGSILQNHWQKTFAFPWDSLIGSWKNAFIFPLTDYSLIVGVWEAIPATFGILLIPTAFKYLKKSWALYYSAYILFITSTNFLLSTPRYLLLNIPIFVILAFVFQKHKKLRLAWIFVSSALLTYFAILFVSGQWAF